MALVPVFLSMIAAEGLRAVEAEALTAGAAVDVAADMLSGDGIRAQVGSPGMSSQTMQLLQQEGTSEAAMQAYLKY
ncbi:MAG TPA: hypothetical protein VN457_00655, partial [Chlamydiales bacterium]|nr:hypothetical protein [Chlamydiales bacterium]